MSYQLRKARLTIKTSGGSRCQFPTEGIALVEDTTGKGRRGRAIGGAQVLVASVSLPVEAVIA
jgi:hypothetical protein